MSTPTLVLPLLYRRRRAFFLLRCTQQVRTAALGQELLRAAAAMAVVAGWGALAVLLAG
jgi:hypothetical protein